jgi:class 3 adenylate cyclase
LSSDTEQRKLAAIMFTDMAGYSTLAQRDEALAAKIVPPAPHVLRSLLSET